MRTLTRTASLWIFHGAALAYALLPHVSAPTPFKMLRPIAVLLASAKLWSRCFFTILGEYGCDTECSPSHLGFRLGHSCSEVVASVRLLVENRSWRARVCLVQLYFARAYHSMLHTSHPRLNVQAEGSSSRFR